MSGFWSRYRICTGLLMIPVLFLISIPVLPQVIKDPDSTLKASARIFSYRERTNRSSASLLKLPDTIIPSRTFPDQNTTSFLNSIESRASKNILTKKLFDLIVIQGDQAASREVSENSQAVFTDYEGKQIKSITIKRLDVFGTSINNPMKYEPGKVESFLNKTHLNTNEYIIRKNLLFSVGDSVSPLSLSDNERLLRQLPFIEEARIIVIPAEENYVDLLILTKDLYSLGANFEYGSLTRGTVAIYDKNILGLGHEFRIDMPYDSDLPDSPGFGLEYSINNVGRSFINMDLFYYDGLGKKSYGISLERKLISAESKYAGGISIRQTYTTEDLDTMQNPEPLKYNLQDYWLSRSFLVSRNPVTRIIIGARYTNNNVFDHPFILPDSYYYLQKYRMYLGSASISAQKYYKTSLLYGYGRTEDIPYGGLLSVTAGREINEFKERTYAGIYAAAGNTIRPAGYFYLSAGIAAFFNEKRTEQGMGLIRASYFTNLFYLGRFRMRNFINADYTRGFDRNTDERLFFLTENGFSGFRNDSISGTQRLSLNLESVLFSPANIMGFRFAFFAFSDASVLFGTNQIIRKGEMLSSIGLGIRIRNDNLVFNTLQIRLCYFPQLPDWSRINYLTVSGEQLLKPDNFEPGPPTIIQFR